MHLVDGEINHNGNAVGGHLRDSPNIRIIDEWIDTNTGLNRAVIEIFDPVSGTWVQKNAPSTLFPDGWDASRAITETESAFRNSAPDPSNPRRWIGDSNSGYEITGYYRNSRSAGPGWSTAYLSGVPSK